ncbi:hypothetical protein SCACP_28200 [Sporomusa carbonis]|uniref:hypothetical protein n=1 Tax=Sporomusa carbonis TaxID=3076075 RepID=UPI003A772EA3
MKKRTLIFMFAAILVFPTLICLFGNQGIVSASYAETVAFYHSISPDCNDHN